MSVSADSDTTLEAAECTSEVDYVETAEPAVASSVSIVQFQPTASMVLAAAAATATSARLQYLQPTADLILRAWNNLSSSQCRGEGDSLKVESVLLEDRLQSYKKEPGTEGILYVTPASLVFVSKDVGVREIWLSHLHIRDLEKGAWSQKGNPLTVKSKTFLHVTFYFKVASDREAIYTALQTLSRISDMELLPCFAHVSPTPTSEIDLTGWKFFNLEAEFLRLGVPNSEWSQWQGNRNWEVCDTYPQLLYVPASAGSHTLLGSSRFRSRGRMPVLSYLHRDGQAALCRCSQPLAGFSARCTEDEDLLQAICDSNRHKQASALYVVDTRPKVNAMANRAQGKGYETDTNYRNMRFRFFDIDNIHVMRASQERLFRACSDLGVTMSSYLSAVERSGWLQHICGILEAAQFVAARLEAGHSVLVHCSDGWDRTAQTCSLAQLLLDPYYRTITGFQALIEKEWLWFGHKFSDRCGHLHKPGEHKSEMSEQAPIFTQFLESVWQLLNRFPTAFQFNERMLLALHDEAYALETGTFVGNCAKDRVDLRLDQRTCSLWGQLLDRHTDFLNPLYQPPENAATIGPDDVLWLSEKQFLLSQQNDQSDIPIPPQSLKVWRGLYNRWESSAVSSVHPKESWLDSLSSMVDNSLALSEHCDALQTRVSQLCGLLGIGSDDVGSLPASESLLSLDLLALTNSHATGKDDAESGFGEGSCSSRMSKSLSSDTDSTAPSNCCPTADQLLIELRSLSLDWDRPRSAHSCIHSCKRPFEYHMRKYNCWSCGQVFCSKCIDRRNIGQVIVPGLSNTRCLPLCTTCRKKLQQQK